MVRSSWRTAVVLLSLCVLVSSDMVAINLDAQTSIEDRAALRADPPAVDEASPAPDTPAAEPVQEGFDWGGKCGAEGSGSFLQNITEGGQVEVGVIPAGKESIRVELSSDADIDLRVYEKDGSQTNLVGWPKGQISGPGKQSLVYRESLITWSGYNGVDGKLGHEYIEITRSELAADLVLFAFGYKSGRAKVEYSYKSAPCTKSFTLFVGNKEIKTLGLIPAELSDVEIKLSAAQDVDIQVQEDRGNRTLVVGWPNGVLKGHGSEQKLVPLSSSLSQLVSYSGYNGQGGKGNEWIKLHGTTSTAFEMRVFGYAAGDCTVTYSWRNPPSAEAVSGRIVSVDMLPVANRQDKARKVFLYRDPDVEHGRLIIRRGSYATVKLYLDVELKESYSVAAALNAVGYDYRQLFDTHNNCEVEDITGWSMCIAGREQEQERFVYTLKLLVPVTAPLAEWTLTLRLLRNGQTLSKHVESARKIFTIFNPYHPSDPVYLNDEAGLTEYLENENGAIWVGSEFNSGPKRWAYNQFNIKALIAAYHLLARPTDNGFTMDFEKLADPVSVSRALSYKVAAHMLTGRWSEPYCEHNNGGPCANTKPWAWAGSMPIIAKYLTDFRAVRWGQCFVFAGVLNTLGRAIGIPTRAVSNFESAHDHKPFDNFVTKHWTYGPVFNPGTNEIVKYSWTHNGEKDADSVWNFHVWNEMNMRREDLEDVECGTKEVEYHGWQVVDATWQEQSNFQNLMSDKDSNKYYQCGPVPLTAIRHKCDHTKFDYKFVHSEVEADQEEVVRNLKTNPNSNTWERDVWGYTVNKKKAGKRLSTSAVGGNPLIRDTITRFYKVSEDTEQNLGESGVITEEFPMFESSWGTVSVKRPSRIEAGGDYAAVVSITRSNTSEMAELDATWSIAVNHYDGKESKSIKQQQETLAFDELGKATLVADLKSFEYAGELKHGVTLAFTAAIQEGEHLLARFSGVKTLVSLPAIDVEMTSEPVMKRCQSQDDQVGFSMTVHNPFKQLPINASTLFAEISGMDKTPEYGNPEWELSIPALAAGESHTVFKTAVSVSSLGCGVHAVSTAWEMDEFAESTDAVGSVEFTVDCSSCSSNMAPEDESKEARMTPEEVLQQQENEESVKHELNPADKSTEEDSDEAPPKWNLVKEIKKILNLHHK